MNKQDVVRNLKKQFYIVDGKLYRLPTFITRFNSDWELIRNDELEQYQSTLRLLWNRRINRFCIYRRVRELPWRWREYIGSYTFICVVEGPNKTFRHFGTWVINQLRKLDLSANGRDDLRQVVKKQDETLLQPSDAEKAVDDKLRDINRELQKDYEWLKTGYVGIAPDIKLRPNRKRAKRRVIFVGKNTGKVLGERYV